MEVFGRQCADQHDLVVAILLAAGGEEAERLKPPIWRGQIADVVYPSDNWIFEVKCLETDRPADPKVQRQIGDGLHRDAPRFGGPIGWGTQRVEVSKLPDKTAHNLLRKVGQTVQKAVDQANRQIKATREAIDRPGAKRCVAIVSPPHELSPRVLSWLVADALRDGRNKAINSVMIAQTPLLAPFGSFADRSSYVTFPGVQGTNLPTELKLAIGRAWCSTHDTPMIESTVEQIDGMVQDAVRRSRSR